MFLVAVQEGLSQLSVCGVHWVWSMGPPQEALSRHECNRVDLAVAPLGPRKNSAHANSTPI